MLIIFLIFLHFFIFSFFFSNSHFFTFSSFHAHRHERKRSVPDWIIVVVVEWLVGYSERIFLSERLTLANFSLIFVSKMCVFASRPMENVTFLKNDVFPKFVVDFLRPQQRHTPTHTKHQHNHTNTNTHTNTTTDTTTHTTTTTTIQSGRLFSSLFFFFFCFSSFFNFLHFLDCSFIFSFFMFSFFHVFFVFPSLIIPLVILNIFLVSLHFFFFFFCSRVLKKSDFCP